jgi:alcohol dehydrogenase (cytochrome c)
MYLALPGGVVQALNAATGDFMWEFRHQVGSGRAGQSGGIRGGLVLYGDKAYIHPADGKLVAINLEDGSQAWESVLFDPADGYSISSTGIAVDGKIISGVRCNGFNGKRCFISAIDAETGREVWKTYTTAVPGEPGGDTWGGLDPMVRPGGDPWITGTYDPNLNLIYWGAAQAKPWHRISRGTGDAALLYTSSTLALDAATGAIEWYYQYVPGESFDMDEHFAFINVDAERRRSGYMMGKMGVLWHLDRVTGQLIGAYDSGLQDIAEIDRERGFIRYRPDLMAIPPGEVSYTCPSTSGFKTAREMAYNPETQAFYIPMSLNCSDRVFLEVEMVPGGGGGGECCRVNRFHPDHPGELGQLTAMDIRGNELWAVRQPIQLSSSVMTTAGGLVFVGDTDRYIRAHDAETGELLWRTRLTTKVSGWPMTYSVDGRQYLAVITGVDAHNWISTVSRDLAPQSVWPIAGTAVFVFALPEN